MEGPEHHHHDARGPGKGEHAGQGDDHGHHFPAFGHQIAVVADGGIGTAAEGDGLTKGVHQVQLKDEDGPEALVLKSESEMAAESRRITGHLN